MTPLPIPTSLTLALWVLLALTAWDVGAPVLRRAWRRYQFTRKARQDDQRQRAAIRARREVANG